MFNIALTDTSFVQRLNLPSANLRVSVVLNLVYLFYTTTCLIHFKCQSATDDVVRKVLDLLTVIIAAVRTVTSGYLKEPAFAAMHGLHSLVRLGPGCTDRA